MVGTGSKARSKYCLLIENSSTHSWHVHRNIKLKPNRQNLHINVKKT